MNRPIKMENNNIISILCGAFLSMGTYLANIDMAMVGEELLVKVLTAGVVGIVGGFGGLLGKQIYQAIFKKKKND